MASESGTALVTDSTASLTAEDRERLDISVVSLYVILNGEQRPESEITDYRAFDTLGEATVLFVAIAAALSNLKAH